MISALTISESNLSVAWAKALLALMQRGMAERHPAIVSISGRREGEPLEDFAIRDRLDAELKRHSENSTATTANTIFPYSMWNRAATSDASSLYSRYERAWPGIKKCPANRGGVYFRRLTSFQPRNWSGKPVNQLEQIAETYRSGNHRKSALQASVFDPTRDHTNSRQKGFPCLQQVAFTPIDEGFLSVTGFYATQYQFEKAYGNYLGLYRLGEFMASQLNRRLVRVTCIASFLSRGEAAKAELEPLASDVSDVLAATLRDEV